MIYALGQFEDWHLLTWLLSSSLLSIVIFGCNYCGDSQFSWWSRSMAIKHKYVKGEKKNMMILITLMINNYWLSLSWIDVDGTRGDYQQINGNRCATDWYPLISSHRHSASPHGQTGKTRGNYSTGAFLGSNDQQRIRVDPNFYNYSKTALYGNTSAAVLKVGIKAKL